MSNKSRSQPVPIDNRGWPKKRVNGQWVEREQSKPTQNPALSNKQRMMLRKQLRELG